MTDEHFILIALFGLGVILTLLGLNHAKKAKILRLHENLSNSHKFNQKERYQFETEKNALNIKLLELAQRLDRSNDRLKALMTIYREKNKQFPWLVTAYADYQNYLGQKEADLLEQKERPAPKAAESVRDATRRAVAAERGFRSLKYRIDFYEKYFPWITEVSGDTLEEFLNESQVEANVPTAERDRDPVLRFLSKQEYNRLSETNRNQLALDRWKSNRKSSWEIGRLYERYVGYKYEQEGYSVQYFGALHGFDDLGRDLIAQKASKTKIVQCKYWSSEKTIHEKHIFQLFGTVVEYIARQNIVDNSLPLFGTFEKFSDIQPVFVTSTSLSDRAIEFARLLGVTIREREPLDDYPLIKCNVSKRTGERVYHLPMDQMYDRTVIEPENGEMYEWTVKNAEKNGFRRAFRWRPEKGD